MCHYVWSRIRRPWPVLGCCVKERGITEIEGVNYYTAEEALNLSHESLCYAILSILLLRPFSQTQISLWNSTYFLSSVSETNFYAHKIPWLKHSEPWGGPAPTGDFKNLWRYKVSSCICMSWYMKSIFSLLLSYIYRELGDVITHAYWTSIIY